MARRRGGDGGVGRLLGAPRLNDIGSFGEMVPGAASSILLTPRFIASCGSGPSPSALASADRPCIARCRTARSQGMSRAPDTRGGESRPSTPGCETRYFIPMTYPEDDGIARQLRSFALRHNDIEGACSFNGRGVTVLCAMCLRQTGCPGRSTTG